MLIIVVIADEISAWKQYGESSIKTITTISLGGITPQEFLRNYWQKQPLLVRDALPGFNGLLTPDELIQMAYHEEVQSRLVIQKKGQWLLQHGPLSRSDFAKLPKKHWTLLVQEVNHFLASAGDLLAMFSFIPYARLDDLMISYAPKGGGVGPHFDSYDVFLLQGMGTRRWQISAQQVDHYIADAPLKILSHFQPEQEWILKTGDMLYLPPNYAHNGIAEDDCMTYSIGFRAPSHHELITQFLVYLQDHIEIDGWYSDPDLQLQTHPSEISSAMQVQTSSILKKINWHPSDIENFLGIYLSEPKSHVFFVPPEQPLTFSKFLRQAKNKGVQLDLKTKLLCGSHKFFINGEIFTVELNAHRDLIELADKRELLLTDHTNKETEKILFQWYVSGYIVCK